MDAVALLAAALLPWLAGTGALVALRERTRALGTPGELAWLVGAGWFVGAFALTLWMRALSLAGIPFGRVAIAAPLVVVVAAAALVAWRRDGRALVAVPVHRLRGALAAPGVARLVRIAAWVLAATLALRFALLLAEVLLRPTFPWEAWTQWATKARVWYEQGRLVPFAGAEAWLAGTADTWFDAAPAQPPTLPLLQVWTCVALGRWDDAAMNLPWWLTAVALALATYGALRALDGSRLQAFAAAFVVSTLPMANTHVALAGYGDFPLAAHYALAALAFLRWCRARATSEAVLATVLALACTQVGTPGLAWALTLVPGVVVALAPARGPRIVGIAAAVAALALAALARTSPVVAGRSLHLAFGGDWGTLAEAAFLLGSWNLLWYGVIGAAVLAGRALVAPALAPLTATLGTALFVLLVLSGFADLRALVADATPVNRLLLQIAPLTVAFAVLAFREFANRHPAAAAAAF